MTEAEAQPALATWLGMMLKQRYWSQADLARERGVDPLAGQQVGPGNAHARRRALSRHRRRLRCARLRVLGAG